MALNAAFQLESNISRQSEQIKCGTETQNYGELTDTQTPKMHSSQSATVCHPVLQIIKFQTRIYHKKALADCVEPQMDLC